MNKTARDQSQGAQRRRLVTRATWLLPFALSLVVIWHVTDVPGPAAIAPAKDATRFGVDLPARKALFAEIARDEGRWRQRSAEKFPGDLWSQHDDYHNQLRTRISSLARLRGLDLSQLYLIYDEGIRSGWTGPRGERPRTRWIPLRPRKKLE